MGIFKIDVDNFTWICGPEDDPEDRCLHGRVTVQVGETRLEDTGTVSATALYLLKTLTEDKLMCPDEIQMVPCCGFFLVANENLSAVSIVGCDSGLDWTTRHEGDGVRIVLASGESVWMDLRSYRQEVLQFADKVESCYRSCQPKKLPDDDFDRNGYLAFWNEWHRRYAEAALKDALETGREVELGHGDRDYFIGRDCEKNWYLYCEQTKEKQTFRTAEDLYQHAQLGEGLLKNQLMQIRIQCIL